MAKVKVSDVRWGARLLPELAKDTILFSDEEFCDL